MLCLSQARTWIYNVICYGIVCVQRVNVSIYLGDSVIKRGGLDHINMFDPATYICLCQEVRTEISNASALDLALVFTGLR